MIKTSNASSALCHASVTHGFVVSGNPTFLLAEQPSSSACSFVVSGNVAFLLLLLHVVFIVTGNFDWLVN